MKASVLILRFALTLGTAVLLGACARPGPSGDLPAAVIEEERIVPGLQEPVEVLRDAWGIPHIYARTVHDLFMAQGYVAATDRLWQMEMWRRKGEGRLAEILGPSALPRDRFARLMKYRGDMEAEWESYAPDARENIRAFVEGVNAYIESCRQDPPVQFRIMGFRPEPWTPEVCLTRMAGYIMTRNAANEVRRAQLVREIGLEAAQEVWPLDPPIPLEIPEGLNLEGITDAILADARAASPDVSLRDDGSNNWTISGRLTRTGKPLLANDPHRTLAIPSLRYMTHLVGPGWNVIGAGEPTLPGVAAGHNERVAWGFTIVGIDQQDLYVEELNPANRLEYRFRGAWKKMRVVREQVKVKGREKPEVMELRFTVHGPVLYEDAGRNRAYALRWVGTEPGTAGYLGALSLCTVKNWEEFLQAMDWWKVPSENLVYADVDGNIGWVAAGITPIRRGWSGVLPVPGTGAYEWEGFLPTSRLPRLYNPPQGYIATANHNILPEGYPHVLGYEWSALWRFRRVDEVLKAGREFTVLDSQRLQHDETSMPARILIALLRETAATPESLEAKRRLLAWDQVLNRESTGATIYEVWIRKLVPLVWSRRLEPPALKIRGRRGTFELAVAWLENPARRIFGPDPAAVRNGILVKALDQAVADLRARLGPDMDAWEWGKLHKAYFNHPLGKDDVLRKLLDRGPVARGGDSTTVNNTSTRPDFRQTHGGSYRQVLDLSDWDRSVGTSVPGQSGDPADPHYDDLLPLWAEGKYHPLAFSRPFVETVTRKRIRLRPAGN